jgi:hypothetical protein
MGVRNLYGNLSVTFLGFSACFFFVSGKYLFRDDFFGYDLSNDVEQL